MFALALGLTIGLLTVIPLGPLSMTIVGVGADQGPHQGVRAALGVVSADTLLASSAVTIVVAGQALPGTIFTTLQLASAVVLMGFGMALIVRAHELRDLVGRVRRPARTLFAMTVLSPAIGSWFALLLASPFTGHATSLALFASGIVAASLLWHPALGAAAGHLAPRLSEHRLLTLTRVGGSSMVGMGLIMLVM